MPREPEIKIRVNTTDVHRNLFRTERQAGRLSQELRRAFGQRRPGEVMQSLRELATGRMHRTLGRLTDQVRRFRIEATRAGRERTLPPSNDPETKSSTSMKRWTCVRWRTGPWGRGSRRSTASPRPTPSPPMAWSAVVLLPVFAVVTVVFFL